MEWVSGFLTPLIKVIFIGGFIGGIVWFVGKGFYNAWTKSWKFVLRYRIRKRSYPEKTILWCMEAVEKGIGWYDAKKILMVKGVRKGIMNETLWIYDQVILELNKQKGGVKNGRKYQRSDSKDETELPNF